MFRCSHTIIRERIIRICFSIKSGLYEKQDNYFIILATQLHIVNYLPSVYFILLY